MADGITTVVSRSAIPEKVQEVTDRAAEHRQQAATVVVQQKAEERVKTVKEMDRLDTTQRVKRKEDDDDADEKKREQERKRRQNPLGKNLDLMA